MCAAAAVAATSTAYPASLKAYCKIYRLVSSSSIKRMRVFGISRSFEPQRALVKRTKAEGNFYKISENRTFSGDSIEQF